jgi:hypothetical protein
MIEQLRKNVMAVVHRLERIGTLIPAGRDGRGATWVRRLTPSHYQAFPQPVVALPIPAPIPTHQSQGALAEDIPEDLVVAPAPGDQAIGWDEAARRHNPLRVVASAHFLISYVLGLASRRLPADWKARYGVRPLLLEIFVDPTRFLGHCYCAANWMEVGINSGRRDGVPKHIFLFPLDGE